MRHHWFLVILALAATSRIFAEVQSFHPSTDVPWIIQQLGLNAKREPENDRAFFGAYGFQRIKIQEEKNSKGTLLRHSKKTSTHSPSVRMEETKFETSNASDDGGKLRTDAKGNPLGKAIEKRDLMMTEDILQRFRFTWVGTDDHAGRPAYVLDFSPSDGPKPERSIKDKFINKAAGRIWVDTNDFFLVKADLKLTDSVAIAGGLVGSVKSCEYKFTRERTAEGYWYTRTVDWLLHGRQFLGQKTVEYHECRTNVVRWMPPAEDKTGPAGR